MNFKVQIENYHKEDDWVEIVAYDAKFAAQVMAEQYDKANYGLANGFKTVARVVDEHGIEKRFELTAAATINYIAWELE